MARIRQYHPRLRDLPDVDIQRGPFQLSDAQLILGREHGFATWSKFAAHIQTLQPSRLSLGCFDARFQS